MPPTATTTRARAIEPDPDPPTTHEPDDQPEPERTFLGGVPPDEADVIREPEAPAELAAPPTHAQLIDGIQNANLVLYQKDQHDEHSYPSGYLPFVKFVAARDRAKNLVLLGGIGAQGMDRMWCPNEPCFHMFPGYADAPELAGQTNADIIVSMNKAKITTTVYFGT